MSNKDLKLIIAGLNNVGKTSIIRKIFGGFHEDDLVDIQPTRSIERTMLSVGNDKKLTIWDFGGQFAYRNQYTRNPISFQSTSLMIYVVDILDSENYNMSYAYLVEILKIIQKFDQEINVAVFLHKFDPDHQNQYREKLFEAQRTFKQIEEFYHGEVRFYTTSIFSESLEFSFSKIIKMLNIPLDIYKEVKISSNIQLKHKDHENVEETISALEFLQNLASIDKQTDTTSELQGLDSIFLRFNTEVLQIYEETINQYSGNELLFVQMEQFMRSFTKYCTTMVSYGSTNGLISTNQINLIGIILGNINFMKIPFLNFILNNNARILSSRIKFLEIVSVIVKELPLFAFIVEIITKEQYNQIVTLFDINSMTFSFFPSEIKQKVYSFNNIEDLKRLNKTENFQKQINLEDVIELINSAITETRTVLNSAINSHEDAFPTLVRFMDAFDNMKIEFYMMFQSLGFKSFDMIDYISTHIESILFKLLKIAKYTEIFTDEEKSNLYLEMSQL